MTMITLNGIRFSRRPIKSGRIDPAGRLTWITDPTSDEIIGAGRRRATSAEARKLNRIATGAIKIGK